MASSGAPAPFDADSPDADSLGLSPVARRELVILLTPLYPGWLTPEQVLNRYAGWVEQGLGDLARFLSSNPKPAR